MTTIGRCFVAIVCVAAFARPVVAQDALMDAKGLYEAASYREALTALDRVGTTGDPTETDKYRALCLMALGLQRDAERALEHLAMSRPLFTLEGTDASPRLVALFGDVRKRMVPEVAKQAYQRGRTSFDAGDMAGATLEFKAVVELADTAPPEHAALLGDLKVLAGGFLRLSEAAAPKPAPKVAAASVALAPPSGPVDGFYSVTNTDARAPFPLARPVPSWVRPASLRGFVFQGVLELEIDQQGNVTSATMKKSVHAGYDPLLLAAAKKWRFQPAMVDGHPVKYRATFPITAEP